MGPDSVAPAPPPGFELVGSGPSAPPPGFEIVDDSAQQAREAAAARTPRGRALQYERNAPTSTWEDVGNLVSRGARRFNKGLAETVGRGADTLVNIPQNGITPTGSVRLTSHPVENFIKERFVGDIPPAQSNIEGIVDAAGTFAGENVPTMGAVGLLSRAPRVAVQQAPTLWNTAKSGYNALMDAAAAKPAATVAGETLAAAEAGAGGEMARQSAEARGATPESQRAQETLGQMVAPSVAAVMPTALGLKALAPVTRKAIEYGREGLGTLHSALPQSVAPAWMAQQAAKTGQRQAREANATVDAELARALAKPESQQGVAEAQQLEQQIPSFRPGLARATNDPVLLNTEEKLNREATGADLRQAQERYDVNAQALRDRMGQMASATPGPPQDVVQGAARRRVERVNDRLAHEQAMTEQRLRIASDALPNAERAQSGARLREIHTEAEQASNNRTNELRAAIARPETPIQVGDQTMTVNEALDRRAAINQRMRQYGSASARTVADVQAMDDLMAERGHIDRALEGVNLPGMQEYRTYYRDEHVPKFQEGAGRDIGRYDRFGYDKNKVPDEKVMGQFGGPNTISAARQFTATHGNNPEAVQLMIDHQLGRLKAEGVDPNTGMLREGAVNRFLTQNRELLDELPPAVRQGVTARNVDDLYARLGQMEQRRRNAENTTLASLLAQKNNNPERTLDAAMNDWQLMKQLKRSVGNTPEANAALTRAVMDRAPDPANATKFRQWLETSDRVLRQVLTPQHLADLRTIAKAAEMHNRVARPTGAVELPKSILGALGDKTGVTVPSAVGSALSVARGRTSPLTEMPMQAVKLWNKQKQNAVNTAWREALSNPDLARTVSGVMGAKQATPLQISKMYTHLLTAGLLHPHNEQE